MEITTDLFINYNFADIAKHLDELIILNVTPSEGSYEKFLGDVRRIIDNVFIPVTIGGGIKDLETARACFLNGADKIILNSMLIDNSKNISSLVNTYGSQSIVGSLNYIKDEGKIKIYDWRKNKIIKHSYLQYIDKLENSGFGEFLINSVDMCGTGFGYDIDSILDITNNCYLPTICMGGAGKYNHFYRLFNKCDIDAAATANLLNFRRFD